MAGLVAQDTFDPKAYAEAPFDPTAYAKDEAFDPMAYANDGVDTSTDHTKQFADWMQSTQTPESVKQIGVDAKTSVKRQVLEDVPTAGAMVGGMLAGPLGVMPAMMGAGIGSMAGTAVKQAGEKSLGMIKPESDLNQEMSEAMPRGAGMELGGQAIGKGLGFIGKTIGGAKDTIKTFISEESGIPLKNMEVYAKKYPVIDKLIQELKASPNALAEKADQIKQNLVNQINSYKKSLSDKITGSLEQLAEKPVDISPVIETLEKAKQNLHPQYQADDINAINDLIGFAKSGAQEAGEGVYTEGSSAYVLQRKLQDMAKGAYAKNGQIFNLSGDAAKAAKMAARDTRLIVNQVSPEIAAANNEYSYLHGIDNVINKNMLKPGASEASLLSAGSGANSRNASILGKLDKRVGSDALGQAEELSAANNLKGTGSVLSTGKAVGGAIKGGLIAGPHGALAGLALSSPAAIRAAIRSGQITSEVAESALGFGLKDIPELADPIIKSALERVAGKKFMDYKFPNQR